MASKAIRTQGTAIAYKVPPGSTFLPLGEVISFDGPGGRGSVIDITNLASTAKEKLPGLPDEGQLAMVANFHGADAGQQALYNARNAQTLISMQLTLTDASIIVFNGYILEYKLTGRADSKVELALTMEITGLGTPTWGTT